VNAYHPIRIVIFDQTPVYAQGLVMLLAETSDLTCVGTVATVREAQAALDCAEPDIVLVASPMVTVDVAAFVRGALAMHPHLKFVALGDDGRDPFPIRLIRAGLSGYLLKSCEPSELNRALRAVSRGRCYVSSPVASALVKQIQRGSEGLRHPGIASTGLTEREAEVLEWLAVGRSNQAIADALQVSVRTVENHVQKVYGKLGVHHRALAVRTALHLGYVLPLRPELWPESPDQLGSWE
jgi:two-component system, NarL family, response regulator DevR